MTTIESLKTQAKRLRSHLAGLGLPLTHSQALEAVAVSHGFRNWNTALAGIAQANAGRVEKPKGAGQVRLQDVLESHQVGRLIGMLVDMEAQMPHGFIHSARQMYAELQAGGLPAAVADQVGMYLFDLPGFRYGRHDDAEEVHQLLLRRRASKTSLSLNIEPGQTLEQCTSGVNQLMRLAPDRIEIFLPRAVDSELVEGMRALAASLMDRSAVKVYVFPYPKGTPLKLSVA